MLKTDHPIIVEQFLPAPAQEVWKSITDLEYMKQWFFDNIPAFQAEEGFETSFNVNSGERDFMHLWKITKVIPGQQIVYNWQYEEYPGEGEVTFELLEAENGTIIRLTNEILESFPQDIPEFKRESCEGGWNYFIKDRLKNFIEN